MMVWMQKKWICKLMARNNEGVDSNAAVSVAIGSMGGAWPMIDCVKPRLSDGGLQKGLCFWTPRHLYKHSRNACLCVRDYQWRPGSLRSAFHATKPSSTHELNSVDRCHPNIYSEIHVFIRIYTCFGVNWTWIHFIHYNLLGCIAYPWKTILKL